MVEACVIWCRFKAPIIDRERREKFTQWRDQSILASGGESVHCLNVFLDHAWRRIFSQPTCDFAAKIFGDVLQDVSPFFITNLHVKNMTFGKKPVKILQIITEQPIFDHSVQYDAKCVLSNDFYFEIHFKVFLIPITVTFTQPIGYAPLRFIIECPESNDYMNLPIITSIDVTALEKIILMSSVTYVNGFEATKVPMIAFLGHYTVEHVMEELIVNGEAVGWDWVTDGVKLRHMTRPCTSYSEKVFSPVAKMDPNTEKLPRFSLPNSSIQRYEETRKTYWGRLNLVKLDPNEQYMYMSPEHGQPIDPVFPFREEQMPGKDAETQTEELNVVEK